MNVFRINATTVAIDGVIYVAASVRPSKVIAKDPIPAIMRLIERRGPLTQGIVVNNLRQFDRDAVVDCLSDLVAVGRLCMSVSVHHYTNQEIKTYSLPPKP